MNIETARIREQISQPLPGEIRLQWWRDVIANASVGIADAGAGHPLASALLDTIVRFGLPQDAFERFLDARIFDLYDDPMPSREAFEAYAGETASALIMLSALILDREAAAAAADAAGHAGVAQTVAGILRLLPVHRARGQTFLPADILAAAGCSREALIAGDPKPAERAIEAMLAFGREHFAAYRAARRTVPSSLRAAFLPADLAAPYFSRIARAGLSALSRPVELGPLARSYTLWRAMRF